MRALSVVIHDVAPATWPACRRLLETIDSLVSLPVTLLVVPHYHGGAADPAFERWLDHRAERGDELTLHGLTHRDDGMPRWGVDWLRRRWYTDSEGEFAGLDEEEATQRLRAGLRWFASHGWRSNGFVAPAWLMSTGTRRALRAQGFGYTATLSRLIDLPSERELHCPSLVYSTRANWRRAASVAWNRVLARTQTEAPLLRLELHPPDVDYPMVRGAWQRLLTEACVDRKPLTLSDVVNSAPAWLWQAGKR